MSKVPSQTLAALCGSRISAAHFPHGRCRTPLYRRLLSPITTASLDVNDEGAKAAAGFETAVCGGGGTSSLTREKWK